MTTAPHLREIFRGAAWIAAGTAAAHLLGLVTAVITARALGPSPVGTVAIALVVLALPGTLVDLGLTPAIAAGRMPEEAVARVRRLVLLNGLVWTGVVVALAPAAARFFADPLVTRVLVALAPTLALNASAAVPTALLQRDGRFRAVALLRGLQQLVTAAGALALVVAGAGVWILVFPGLAASLGNAVASWLLARRPPAASARAPLAPFLREGAQVTGHNLCNTLARNGDNAIVGKVAGSVALGLYAFAYNLLLRPLELFSHSLVPVLLRSLGGSRADLDRTSRAVVDVTLSVLRVGAPVMIGGALTCDLFVPLVFGPKWAPAVPLVRVLMVTGAIQLAGPVFGSMVLARGASAFLLRWGVVTALLSTAAFACGAHFGGAAGVAWAYLAYSAVVVGAMYPIARRSFSLPLAGLAAGAGAVLRDLAAMTAVVVVTGRVLAGAGVSPAPRLASEILAGALVYAELFRRFDAAHALAVISVLPTAAAGFLTRLLRLDLPGAAVHASAE